MMTFHTTDQLRGLGQDVADAAADAVAREYPVALAKAGVSVTADFYAHYPELFASFGTPDPAAMQPSLDAIGKMLFVLTGTFPTLDPHGSDTPVPGGDLGDLTKLEPPATIINHLTGDIGSWHGEAKDAFKEQVLDGFGQTLDNQAAAVKILAASLSMQMSLRTKLNVDVWNIGQQAIDAFKKTSTPSFSNGTGQFVITCVTTLMTCWTVWGVLVDAAKITAKDAASVISGFNNVGKTADGAVAVDTSSPDAVGNSMKSALAKAAKAYADQQAQIVGALNQLSGGMASDGQLFQFSVPASVDALGGEQLGDADTPNTLRSEFHD
jgi:hypothetical protein